MQMEQEKRLVRERPALIRPVLIALFAALSFVAISLIHIPYPAPVGQPFIHFGNMVTILAALLIGGWEGGLSGSIGMGLYDIVTGYGFATIKTIILKFGIGLFTGLFARFGKRHPQANPRVGLAVSGGVSLVLGAFILTGKLLGWPFLENASSMAYVFLWVVGLLLVVLAIVAYRTEKITNEILFAALGAVAGIVFNVAGEFIGGTIMKVLTGAELPAAMLASLMSLPATFINGAASIVGALLLYVPVKSALRAAHLGNLIEA